MHSIYKQTSLPYFSKKPCPKCDNVLSFNAQSCSGCGYVFTNANKEVPKATNDTSAVTIPTKDQQAYTSPQANTFQQPQVNNYQQPINPQVNYGQPQVNNFQQPMYQQPMFQQPMGKVMYCDVCGSRILGTQKFCGACGNLNTKRFCEYCGQIINMNQQFCPYCGGKQSYVDLSNNQQPNGYNQQPLNVVIATPTNKNETTSFTLNPTDPVTGNNDIKTTDTTMMQIPQEEEERKVEIIKIGRKRTFLIIQLLIVLLIMTVATLLPILVEGNVFKALIPALKGTYLKDSLFTGKDLIVTCFEGIKALFKDGLNFTNMVYAIYSDEARALFVNENNACIISSIPGISHAVEWIATKLLKGQLSTEIASANIALTIVFVIYLTLLVEFIIAIICSIIGLFNRLPYKQRIIKVICITLLVGSVFIFPNILTTNFAGYDCWMIYAFILTFIYWFVTKLVFIRENKTYSAFKKEKRKQKKNAE